MEEPGAVLERSGQMPGPLVPQAFAAAKPLLDERSIEVGLFESRMPPAASDFRHSQLSEANDCFTGILG